MIRDIWKSNMGWRHQDRLRHEAQELSVRHHPPVSKRVWEKRRGEIKDRVASKLHLQKDPTSADFRVHHSIAREGYRIDMVSYASGSPDIRITAALYVPDGDGPFPAVLNLHGHVGHGKIATSVQQRGHILAQNGFVVLSSDAPGSGERSFGERTSHYHGGLAGAALYLIGDSLLGWQVRDNRRSIDVLCDLPFVNADRIGVTGESGGGNQTMWVSACDERVKVCVPVVSVGSFESYVTARNCICETLPGGLIDMEEWELLGLIAPRPLLLLNAYQDTSPAFNVEPATRTAESLREIYRLWKADGQFDLRVLNTTHGYWPEMLSAMLGWMKYWLQGEGPGFSLPLPLVDAEEIDNLRVFSLGSWTAKTQLFSANKETLLAAMPRTNSGNKDTDTLRNELAQCAGYIKVDRAGEVEEGDAPAFGKQQRAVMMSPRGTLLPVVMRDQASRDSSVTLIFGSAGKASAFASERFEVAATAVTIDLPGLGELAWEKEPAVLGGATLHDTGRACLWLGYTLAGEWAECVASLARWAVCRFPGLTLKIAADGDTALAVLLAAALDPVTRGCALELEGLPTSAVDYYRATEGSMAMMIPGLLAWGDLDLMRQLGKD